MIQKMITQFDGDQKIQVRSSGYVKLPSCFNLKKALRKTERLIALVSA